MTKSDLVRIISVKNDMSLQAAEQVVDTFFGTMTKAMEEGRRVELRGFGSFSVRDYDGYMGRNPRSGNVVSVAPKRLPFFKVGKEMRESVDAK